jgi:hypothetical protein
MSLTSVEDALAPSTKVPGESVAARIAARIADPVSPMPPRQFGALAPDELAILDGWVDDLRAGRLSTRACASSLEGSGGASASAETATPAPPEDSGAGDSFAPSVPSALPPDAQAPPPAVEDTPYPPDPSECETTYEFHARRDATNAPFPVGTGTVDLYNCFSFHVDLAGPTHALQFRPHIDKARVVHHWILYATVLPQVDGVSSPCLGLHRDAFMLAGWAPGAGDWNLPRHVGMDLGTGDFILEVHYNNFGEPTEDASGVDVCATTKLRPETASLSWLGTELIALPPLARTSVLSNCRPNITTPIHVLRSWPHMHLLGRRMKADIHRAAGGIEPLFDVPFDFNNQWQYDTPAVLGPGDWIETTCEFDNTSPFPVTFGEGTGNEMCYNFTIAYPAGALVSVGLHNNACNN